MYTRLKVSSLVQGLDKSRSNLVGQDYYAPPVNGFVAIYTLAATSGTTMYPGQMVVEDGNLYVAGRYLNASSAYKPYLMQINPSTAEVNWAIGLSYDSSDVGLFARTGSGNVVLVTRASGSTPRATFVQVNSSGGIVNQQYFTHNQGSMDGYGTFNGVWSSSDSRFVFSTGTNTYGTYVAQQVLRTDTGFNVSSQRRINGGPTVAYPYGIDVDSSGNSYQAQHFDEVGSRGYDFYISRTNSSGSWLASRYISGSTGASGGTDVAYTVSVLGTEPVAGGQIDDGGGKGFVAKFASDLSSVSWGKTISSAYPYSVKNDGTNIYVYGSRGAGGVSIIKFDGTGTVLFQRFLSKPTSNFNAYYYQNSLAVSGSFMYTGMYTTYDGSTRLAIAKLPTDGSGTRTWQSFAGSTMEYGVDSQTVATGSWSSSSHNATTTTTNYSQASPGASTSSVTLNIAESKVF